MPGTLLEENTGGGVQTAYVFGGQQAYGAGYGAPAAGAFPGQGGSLGGVPDNATVNSGDAQYMPTVAARSAVQAGAEQGTRPAWNQPIMWAVVSVFLGLFILAHLAHLYVRAA